jgi:uncharacterized membrane protein
MDAETTSRERGWLWLILTAGAVLRFYRLDAQSLWSDEGLQYFVAHTESVYDVFRRLSRTFHPPLSFLIHHAFLQLSNTDFFFRLPSTLFGIGSVPLVYSVGRHITTKPVALFAVLVFAVSPFHVWYSQEGRMYAQLLFLSLLSTYCLLRAFAGSRHWWGWYILAVSAGMYTHVFMGLGVLVHCCWVVLYYRRRILAYCLSGMVVVALCLPLVLQWGEFFFSTVKNIQRPTEGPGKIAFEKRGGFTWAALPYTFFVYGAGFSLGPSVAELHEERSVVALRPFLPVIVLVGMIFGGGLVIGLLTFPAARPLVLCLLGLVVPLLGVSSLSLMTHFVFNVRYTIVAFPYFCFVLGAALAFLRAHARWLGVSAVCVVLGVSLVSLANHFFNPYYAKEDIRAAVAHWRMVARHEILLVASTGGGGKDAVRRYLDATEQERMFVLSKRNILQQLDRTLLSQQTTSAYLILVRDWRQVTEQAIRQVFAVEQAHTFPGVQVLRIRRSER